MLRTTPLLEELEQHKLVFEWTSVKLVADDPAKTLDESDGRISFYPDRLSRVPQRSLDILALFVPSKRGEDMLIGFRTAALMCASSPTRWHRTMSRRRTSYASTARCC